MPLSHFYQYWRVFRDSRLTKFYLGATRKLYTVWVFALGGRLGNKPVGFPSLRRCLGWILILRGCSLSIILVTPFLKLYFNKFYWYFFGRKSSHVRLRHVSLFPRIPLRLLPGSGGHRHLADTCWMVWVFISDWNLFSVKLFSCCLLFWLSVFSFLGSTKGQVTPSTDLGKFFKKKKKKIFCFDSSFKAVGLQNFFRKNFFLGSAKRRT